jgi:hypothetical protein
MKISEEQMSELYDAIKNAFIPEGDSVAGEYNNGVALWWPWKGSADEVRTQPIDYFVTDLWEGKQDEITEAIWKWCEENQPVAVDPPLIERSEIP